MFSKILHHPSPCSASPPATAMTPAARPPQRHPGEPVSERDRPQRHPCSSSVTLTATPTSNTTCCSIRCLARLPAARQRQRVGRLYRPHGYSPLLRKRIGQADPERRERPRLPAHQRQQTGAVRHPGALVQRFEFDPFTLELELCYGDARTALVRTRLINHTDAPHPQAELAGELLNQWDANKTVAEQYPPGPAPSARPSAAWHSSSANCAAPGTSCKAAAPATASIAPLPSRTTLDEQGLGYVSEASLTLAAKGQQDIYTLQSYVHSSADASRFEQAARRCWPDPPAISTTPSAAGRITWRAALQSGDPGVGAAHRGQGDGDPQRQLALPAGAILHDGVTPPTPPAGSTGSGPGTAGSTPTPWPTSTRGSQEQRARHV